MATLRLDPKIKQEVQSYIKQYKKYEKFLNSVRWDVHPFTLKNLENTRKSYITSLSSFLKTELNLDLDLKEERIPKSRIEEVARYLRFEDKKTGKVDFISTEYNFQYKTIISNMLKQVKFILKNTEGYWHLSTIENFIEVSVRILETFIERGNDYLKSTPWDEIEDLVYQKIEMAFQAELMGGINDVKSVLEELSISTDSNSLTISIFNDLKIPITMWSSMLENEVVSEYIKEHKVDKKL